ncbi:MAG: pentapeptide repeat-containing protein [Pseudomonadota bacterium]|nr:pentapeptide repeat-containing protein [Pseudomonadota bacterium]
MADGDEPGDEPPAEEPKYDQAFFLKLARQGKEDWNKWRRANILRPVTFAGTDFSEAPWDEIDFSGFEFGEHADFSRCKWRGAKWAESSEAFKPGHARFTTATFGDNARFTRATFGDKASFDRAAFGWLASFDGAAFGGWASFDGAAFGDYASFADTRFKGRVAFKGKSKEQWSTDLEANADEKGREAGEALKKWHEDLWKLWGSGPDHFLSISFANARFDGEAVFSGRSFEQTADFTNARFYYPPDFDAATNVARIDFIGAHVGFAPPGKLPWTKYWTNDSRIPLRLRAFRKIVEGTKNHDLERNLYIEERRAERGVYLCQLFERLKKDPKRQRPLIALRLATHILWILIMGVYWALSNYGRHPVLPVVWLVVSVFIFHCGYVAILAPLMPQAGTLDAAKYERTVCMVALGNAVPFVGPLTIDTEIKKFLFCPGFGKCLLIPPEWFQLLVIAQNVLSIILVFFIGLALRNYFKIK